MALRDKNLNTFFALSDKDPILKPGATNGRNFGVIGRPSITSGVTTDQTTMLVPLDKTKASNSSLVAFQIFRDNVWTRPPAETLAAIQFLPPDGTGMLQLRANMPSEIAEFSNDIQVFQSDIPPDGVSSHVSRDSFPPLESKSIDNDELNKELGNNVSLLGAEVLRPSPRRLVFHDPTSSVPVVGKCEENATCERVVVATDGPSPNRVLVTRPGFAVYIGELVKRGGDGIRRAESLLYWMIDHFESGSCGVYPDGGMFARVMKAYADQGNPSKVADILQLMCFESDKGREHAMPNVRHYTSLLYAWQMANLPEGPDRCEEILATMHKLSAFLPSCKPDTVAYTCVIHCWADSTRKDAPERALALFREMEELYEAGDESFRPDQLAHSTLLNAILNGGAYTLAEDFLWKIVDSYLNGSGCEPSIRALNSVLAAWAKSIAPYAPDRIEGLVRRWVHVVETTDLDVRPDRYTYGLLLKGWASSSCRSKAVRILSVLEWMERLADGGDTAAELDVVKLSTAIAGWISSKSYVTAADFLTKTTLRFLSDEKPLSPDISLFAKTISGLCCTGRVFQADELLRLLWRLSSKVKLPSGSANELCLMVVKYWGKLNRPDLAESLAFRLGRLQKQGASNNGSEITLLQALVSNWEQSMHHDKVERARVLRRKIAKMQGHSTNHSKGRGR